MKTSITVCARLRNDTALLSESLEAIQEFVAKYKDILDPVYIRNKYQKLLIANIHSGERVADFCRAIAADSDLIWSLRYKTQNEANDAVDLANTALQELTEVKLENRPFDESKMLS